MKIAFALFALLAVVCFANGKATPTILEQSNSITQMVEKNCPQNSRTKHLLTDMHTAVGDYLENSRPSNWPKVSKAVRHLQDYVYKSCKKVSIPSIILEILNA